MRSIIGKALAVLPLLSFFISELISVFYLFPVIFVSDTLYQNAC